MHIGKTSKALAGIKQYLKRYFSVIIQKRFYQFFKTEDLEHFAKNFRIGFQKEAYDPYGKIL